MLVAVLASTAVSARLPYAAWRNLHFLSFPAYALALLHGIRFDGYCYAELGEPSCDGVRVLKYFRGMLRSLETA